MCSASHIVLTQLVSDFVYIYCLPGDAESPLAPVLLFNWHLALRPLKIRAYLKSPPCVVVINREFYF